MYRRLMELEQAGVISKDTGPTFYNVGCRENDVLDWLGENFGPRTFGNTNVIGHNGLGLGEAPRWLDLQIDKPELRDWLRAYRKLDISGDQPGTVWDHWYYYTHRGNMEFYRRILRERDAFAIDTLRRTKVRIGSARAVGLPQGIESGRIFGD